MDILASVTGSRSATRPAGQAWRRGFTIVEAMAAIVILSIGVLALGGTAALVARLLNRADQQTAAALAAQARFERLRATPCANIASGSAVVGAVRERWTVMGTVGTPPLRLREVHDSVWYIARGVSKGHGYQSVIECLP